MPNRAGRNAKRSTRGQTLDEILTPTQDKDKTVTNVQVPDFTGLVESAPEGYKPDRTPAGRTRVPSQFDEVLPKYHGQGWQKIPHDGALVFVDGKPTKESLAESNASVIKKELVKAQHLNGLGMDVNITETHVEFNVRDLQKRKAKEGETADAEGNFVENAED